MRAIVVGYDGTDAARRALERAAAIGESFGVPLVVASIAPYPLPPEEVERRVDPILLSSRRLAPEESPERRRLVEEAREILSGRVEADYVTAVGDPEETLLDIARDREADLVVVGAAEAADVDLLLVR